MDSPKSVLDSPATIMNQHTLDMASLSELEALLATSRHQEQDMARELDSFVNSHLDDFQSLFTDANEDFDLDLMRPLTEKYSILQTLEDACKVLVPLQAEMSALKARACESKRLQEIDDSIASATTLIAQKQFMKAYEVLDKVKLSLQAGDGSEQLFSEHISLRLECVSDKQMNLLRQVVDVWDSSLFVEGNDRVLHIHQPSELPEAIKLQDHMGTLQSRAKAFAQSISDEIVKPLLTTETRLTQNEDTLTLTPTGQQQGLAGLSTLVNFLRTNLPEDVLEHIRPQLGAAIVHSLRNEYVPNAVPGELQSKARIEALTSSILSLQSLLEDNHFISTRDLSDLINDIPVFWFEKRRGLLLDQCRHIILDWTGTTEAVEQNEDVAQESLLQPATTTTTTTTPVKNIQQVSAQLPAEDADEDWGSSEWDAPEDIEDVKQDIHDPPEDDGTDAWGLDDDLLTTAPGDASLQNLGTITLSARYIISTMSKELLQIINQCKDDSSLLRTSSNEVISSQHASLLSLETEILNLYKVLVPVIIARTGYPRMTIYNDCIYLASHSETSIRSFGEHYYTLELQDKLDQMHALLERTEAFTNVTIPVQKETCSVAIQGVLDLLTRIGERYEAQLGRTTFCTALGTLSDAAIVYFVDSIMAMTDISESESIELAKLGDALSRLENLFKGQEDGETVLTAMWCPNWFRFRLLLDILEAKLDYILELWNDGDLVDFEPGEVTELIRALFSDSPKRRNAIDHIMANV